MGAQLHQHDPLRFRRLSSPQVRSLIEWVVQGIEGYGHGGNGSAKTEEFAALFVRMCRGQTRMDGRLLTRQGCERDPADEEPHWIALPGLLNGEPWRHWVLVQSYDQAKDSSMRAYRKVLGRWPHKIGWLDRANGKIKLIKVKPELPGWSDDPETWSEITFISQEAMTDEDVRYVQGARVHSVHGDEMPKQSVWAEVRARRIANAELYKVITATPEYKHEWAWCRADFLGCYFQPVRGRVRVQWSVDDNRALSLEDIARRKRDYLRGDGTKSDLYDARVAGEHVDVSGACPFPHTPIQRLLDQCQPGRLERYILRDGDDGLEPAEALVERWMERDPRHVYLAVADTSRGIDDDEHDPCELQVWDWTEPMLVCRYGMRAGKGGFLDEDALAMLAEMLGREYGNCLIDWEVSGAWGQQFGMTLRRLKYPNLSHDDRTLKPGVIVQEYGWTASPRANGEIVAALQKGLNDNSFRAWSVDAIGQWKDVREDIDGRPAKVAKGARHHRESMICAGRAMHWIQTRTPVVVPEKVAEPGMREVLRKEFGRKVDFGTGHRRNGMPEMLRPEV